MRGNGTATGNGSSPLGEPVSQAKAEQVLTGEPLSLSYRPSLTSSLLGADGDWRYGGYQQCLYDVERMLGHDAVELPFSYLKSAIANVKFTIKANSSAVAEFVHRQLSRFWERALETVQEGYDYGWGAGEVCYQYEKGQLQFDSLHGFHPLDCYALTVRHRYVGVSVNGSESQGQEPTPSPSRLGMGGLRLWGPRHWPAKGWWFAHRRRFDRFYGRTQLWSAWRAWRRLATRDGAEDVIDGGFFRFAYRGPEVRYPPEDFRRKGTSGDMDFDAARNAAREFAETAKAGVSYALPNSRDPSGEYKWQVNWPERTLGVEGLLNYPESLEKKISRGIGVPPELLEASEVGSGWSGRAIPMLGFYAGRQKDARSIVRGWKEQIGDPLVLWNHGPDAWFEVEVEVVLPTALQQQKEEQEKGGKEQAPGGTAGQEQSAPGAGQPPQPQAPPPQPGGPGLQMATDGELATNAAPFPMQERQAASQGLDKLLDNPIVALLYPYAAVEATHDDRARPEHLAMEHRGIQDSNVYRRDDPVFKMFKGPWDWGCRCVYTPLSVREAARRGIQEAIEWERTGVPPEHPAHVEMPPFRPDPDFQRRELSTDPEGREHKGKGEGGGQFTGKGGGGGTATKADKKSPRKANNKVEESAADEPAGVQSTPKQHRVAIALAKKKFANVTLPTEQEIAEAREGLARLGANSYRRNIVGNSSDRAKRRQKLYKEFGDGKQCPCVYCGVMVSEGTMEQDKIMTTAQGGRYRIDNVLPACKRCNNARGDKPFAEVIRKVRVHA